MVFWFAEKVLVEFYFRNESSRHWYLPRNSSPEKIVAFIEQEMACHDRRHAL